MRGGGGHDLAKAADRPALRHDHGGDIGPGRSGGRAHGEDLNHAEHAGDGQNAAQNGAGLASGLEKRHDKDAEGGSGQNGGEGNERQRQETAPLDGEDQVPKKEQDGHLHQHGEPNRQEFSAQHGGLGGGGGEEARQGASLVFAQDGLGSGGAGVEGIEDGHAAHDEADEEAEGAGSWFFGDGSIQVKQGGSLVTGRDAGQVLRKSLLDQGWVGGAGLFGDHLNGQLGARQVIDELGYDRLDDTRTKREGGVFIQLQCGVPVQGCILLREIGRNEDGHAGFLAIHLGPGGGSVSDGTDLDQISKAFILKGGHKKVAERMSLRGARDPDFGQIE